MAEPFPGLTATTSDRVIGWDVETHLIKDGCKAPKLVCVAFDYGDEVGEERMLLNAKPGLDQFEAYLDDMHTTLVAHHAPYDLGVAATERPRLLSKIFAGIDRGDIVCSLLREQIIDNVHGDLKYEWDEQLEQFKRNPGYALATRIWRRFGRERVKGADSWQLRYSQLDGVPTYEYPIEASEYAMLDATDSRMLYDVQCEDAGPEGIPSEISQIAAGWGLRLMQMWGVRTEGSAVEQLEHKLIKERNKWRDIAHEHGFIRDTGSKNMKAIKEATEKALKELGKRPMLTKGGAVSTKREQLMRCKTVAPGLEALAQMGKSDKQLNTYVPVLYRGTEVPICPEYNTIIETFRTSCREPNLQNAPRKGGIRDCFVARDDYVFGFCDYDTLEMRTLAQVCLEFFGYSEIAAACIRGEDFHLSSAADMLGISYEEAERRYKAGDEVVDDARQLNKIANYGFGGGMAAKTFVAYARGYGVTVSLEVAEQLHATYRRKWKEVNEYFAMANRLCSGGIASQVQFPRSKLVRGRVGYTQINNGFFQHRAAMGAKAAVYEVARECYTDRTSPLWNCRPWLFAHDEIGMEIPRGNPADMHASMMRLKEIMEEQMSVWCPQVPIGASGAMTLRWYKGAKPVYDANGFMIPCKPEGKKWVADLH